MASGGHGLGHGLQWLPDLRSPWKKGDTKALVVRDLASQCVLALVPAASENAELVGEALEKLIAIHGARWS